MPAYKDQNKGTWFAAFYYEDWTGKKIKKYKRGFPSKKDALNFEREFCNKAKGNMDMTFESFTKVYFEDKSGELKPRSIRNKQYMISTHIIPYFGLKKMNEITPADIISWQNDIKQNHAYSDAYLRMLQNQLTAIFTHASKIYNLENNPCKKVKKMGKSDGRSLVFWTEEEYKLFIATFEKGSMHYVIFEILFWTGCRIGEVLALTRNDFDFEKGQMQINKTFSRINRKDNIDKPKTASSIRTIDLPDFLTNEVQKYCDRLYGQNGTERIFPIVAEAVQHVMKSHTKKAGIKKIRVHDLRHSHASYLIHLGVQPLIIKERLGHKDIRITLNTYGHLYPSEQKKVASLINNMQQT
ncbi:MAG: site-specific integrase [Lachnospiraceae bacterium]|nr:site-specific integrase [Lachnospiraceae bacterium]